MFVPEQLALVNVEPLPGLLNVPLLARMPAPTAKFENVTVIVAPLSPYVVGDNVIKWLSVLVVGVTPIIVLLLIMSPPPDLPIPSHPTYCGLALTLAITSVNNIVIHTIVVFILYKLVTNICLAQRSVCVCLNKI